MYTPEQIEKALHEYHRRGSISATIRCLGSPTRSSLYIWIAKSKSSSGLYPYERTKRKTLCIENTQEHPQHPSFELKLKTPKRCFEDGEDIKAVSAEIGYSRTSIYCWRRIFINEGDVWAYRQGQ